MNPEMEHKFSNCIGLQPGAKGIRKIIFGWSGVILRNKLYLFEGIHYITISTQKTSVIGRDEQWVRT